MNDLTGMIKGSGQVKLISGRIRRYRVGLGLTGWVWLRYVVRTHESVGPRRRPAGPRRPRVRGETGWAAP
jgi:hypothetical protein